MTTINKQSINREQITISKLWQQLTNNDHNKHEQTMTTINKQWQEKATISTINININNEWQQ